MTAGLEMAAAEEFIYSALTADATLTAAVTGVFNIEAPEKTPYPFVIYQFMSGVDYAAVGAFRIWANLVYLVKVVAELEHVDSMDAIAARIDTLLHRGSGPVADGTVWACVREQVIRVPETVSGKQYRHAGGIFRIYAS